MSKNHYLYNTSDRASMASRASTLFASFNTGVGSDHPDNYYILKLLL